MKINHNQIVFGLFFFNILILITAYCIEYILKVPACSMCIYQRIPYFLSTIIIVVFFLKKIDFKKLIIILFLFTLINTGLSFYHMGIEQGFFNELNTCKDEINASNTKDLLSQLKSKGVVSCKEVGFTIFGLSLATINFIVNIILIMFYWIILKNEKN
ncbi:disulfide bond formation protein B [Pelagibacteraceae bacterium]|nr:disulfide bond formation protein B [Pelagibacteraceae bacterium]